MTASGKATKAKVAAKPRKTAQRKAQDAIDTQILRQFVWTAKGDPRLTPWEEMFVNSMDRLAQDIGAGVMSDKQWAVLRQIAAKVEPALPTSDTEAEAEPDPLVEDDPELARALSIIETCDASLKPGD